MVFLTVFLDVYLILRYTTSQNSSNSLKIDQIVWFCLIFSISYDILMFPAAISSKYAQKIDFSVCAIAHIDHSIINCQLSQASLLLTKINIRNEISGIELCILMSIVIFDRIVDAWFSNQEIYVDVTSNHIALPLSSVSFHTMLCWVETPICSTK